MVKLPKIVQKEKMHKLLNRFNWTNSAIKVSWFTWLNNQTDESSETAEITQSISNGLSRHYNQSIWKYLTGQNARLA